MALRDLVKSWHLLGAVLAIGIAALVYAALGGDRWLSSVVFISAWGILVTGLMAGALLRKGDESPLVAPLKVVAIGFAVAAISGIVSFIAGVEDSIGFDIGFAVMLVGIGWAFLRIAKHR